MLATVRVFRDMCKGPRAEACPGIDEGRHCSKLLYMVPGHASGIEPCIFGCIKSQFFKAIYLAGLSVRIGTVNKHVKYFCQSVMI